MHQVLGGCHCGNISYVAEISNEPSVYKPRACDCNFCTSHGAAYVSDNNGSLKITIKNQSELSKYRQGSRIADFLICKNCGVLVGVCYEEHGCIYGSVNTRSSNASDGFGDKEAISPKQLTDEQRIKRWKDFWYSNVSIKYESA